MTMPFTIVASSLYPMIGDVVTLRCDGVPVGERVRWRMISTPPGSALPLWRDGDKPEVLLQAADANGCQFAPDVDGEYTLAAVEESYTGFIPHFDGDGSTTLHPVEEWTEIAVYNTTIYVGTQMTKPLGFAPHTATLRAWVHANASASQGALTAYVDRARMPRIEAPSSDVALMAANAVEVLSELARIGGDGYSDTADLIDCGGAPGGFIYSPASIAYLLGVAINTHVALIANVAHNAADTTNTLTVATPTTAAAFIAAVNALRTKYHDHLALVSVHPNGADTTNLVGAAATTYAEAVTRLNEIRVKYEAHRIRSLTGHGAPGDGRSISRATPYALVSASFDAVAAAYFIAIVANYNAHLGTLGAGEDYHNAADADNTIDPVTATNLAELVAYVNEIAKVLGGHTQNINSQTGQPAASAYHEHKDLGGDMSMIPRANDWASVVHLVDKCAQVFLRHVDVNGAWHGGPYANPGSAFVQLFGINLVHKLFLDAVQSSTLGAPPNALTAVLTMLSIGGFVKS